MSENVPEHEVTSSAYDVIDKDNPKTAAEMLTKAKLVHQIVQIKDKKGLSQKDLAGLLEMDTGDVSRMMRGNFRNIAVGRLIYYLTQLNQDVWIVVEPHPVADEVGSIAVTLG